MRVLGFPLVAELGDGALFAFRDEHRVEAEAFGAAGRERDAARERAGTAQLVAVGADRDELGDVTRTPGPPSRPTTSIPESSPTTQAAAGARPRAKSAFARAFS